MDDMKVGIKEHERNYKLLKTIKTEDVKEENSITSCSKVAYDIEDNEQISGNLNDFCSEVIDLKCEDIKTEIFDIDDVKINIEVYKQNEVFVYEKEIKCESTFKHFDSVVWHQCQFCRYRTKDEHFLNEHVKDRHHETPKSQLGKFRTQKKSNRLTQNKSKYELNTKHDIWHQCPFCKYRTKLEHFLTEHVEDRHSEGSNNESPKCQFHKSKREKKSNVLVRYKSKQELNIKHNDNVVWYKCQFCRYRTKLKHILNKHLKKRHSRSIYNEIHNCHFQKSEQKKSNTQTKSKPEIDTKWYQCEFCEHIVNHKSSLNAHIEVVHKTPDGGVLWYECQFCEFKTAHRYNLYIHFKRRHDEQPVWYQCQYCEYRAKDKRYLNMHFKRKHDASLDWYECKICSFRTKFNYLLNNHIKMKHDEAVWYQCDLCEYRTKKRANFIYHFKTKHTTACDL